MTSGVGIKHGASKKMCQNGKMSLANCTYEIDGSWKINACVVTLVSPMAGLEILKCLWTLGGWIKGEWPYGQDICNLLVD